MSNYVHCNLRIYGQTDGSKWGEIYDLIENYLNPNEDGQEGVFHGIEVKYGNLPEDIQSALREAGLSYIWEYDAGDEFDAGIELYNAKANSEGSLNVNVFNEIVLTLEDAGDQDRLLAARKWQEWMSQEKEFTITEPAPAP